MICKFCNDKGCLCCAGERQKRYNRLYPDGKVEPVFVAQQGNAQDMALLKEYFGAAALDKVAAEAEGDPAKISLLMAIRAAEAREKQRAAKEGNDGD